MKRVNKLKENKALKIILNILYWILVIFTLATLIIVILQRTSNNSLSAGGFRIFNVVTESMMPKYKIGDVLLSRAIDTNNIKVGDDVVYNGEKGEFAGKIVTHRVIDIEIDENGERIFHTQGIANLIEDPEIVGRQIMGVIVGKIPLLSQISIVSSNLYSFYFIIFLPLAVLIGLELRKVLVYFIKKEECEEEEKEEEKEE